jgi:ribosomal peptide maturation radical SAM protein 1
MTRVLLVVPPFHQVFIPAIGVSLLKAALARLGIPCDVWYLNVRYAERLGTDLYTSIASEGRFRALAGEWVFAGDLFGERAPDPGGYLEAVLLGRFGDVYDRAFADRLAALRAGVPAFLDEAMDAVAWDQYAVVGVSSTYQQNCAGLAVLRRLKARYPAVHTAMGGANCEGEMGAALHALFPFVDYVCSGEGDRVVPELVRRLLAGESALGLPGILARGALPLAGDAPHAPMVLDLDRLPYPDYDDYFAQFRTSSLAAVETPTLAVETSRGCWWGAKHHCTFCGLNGGTMQYRSKAPQRALAEIDYLVDRYPSRKLYAIDNILDLSYFDTVLPALAERPRPPRLFYEMKANLSKAQLRLLARAGVWGIQPGIESLSTPILRLMNKGVSGLQNVRLLKWCAEIGLAAEWNFLCGFPGEEPAEYARMADLVPSLVHLQPPAGVGQIRLDRFSPYFTAPEASGLVNVRASLAYGHVYPFAPAELARLAYYFDYDYADGRAPAAYTAALKAAVAAWQAQDEAPRLELRDVGDSLEIHDTRPAAVRPLTTLEGPARLAYLALDAGNTADGVRAALQEELGDAAPPAGEIAGWLEAWRRERLVMREGARYLSLATNPAERVQLPVERFLAQLVGGAP